MERLRKFIDVNALSFPRFPEALMGSPTVDVVPVRPTPLVALAHVGPHPLATWHALAQSTRLIHLTHVVVGVRLLNGARLLFPGASINSIARILRLNIHAPRADFSVVLVDTGGRPVALRLRRNRGADSWPWTRAS